MLTLERAVVAAVCASTVLAYNTDDQVNPDIPFGTFQDPSSNVRPRFRCEVDYGEQFRQV